MSEQFKFHDIGPRGMNEADEPPEKKPRVLLVPDTSGSMKNSMMRELLEESGLDVVIMDEVTEFFFFEAALMVECYKMKHDQPYPDKLFIEPGPKSEFEKRQEWLDGFRKKHQRKGRR